MADTLQPINPLEYISPHDPVPQEVRNASRWFVVESMEITFGDYVGRPESHSIVRVQLMNYLFAEGWYVDAVLDRSEGGNWKSVSSTGSTSDGGTESSTTSTTSGDTTSKTNTRSASRSVGDNSSVTEGSNSSSSNGGNQSTTDTTASGRATGSSSSSSSSTSSSEAYSLPYADARKANSNGTANATSTGESASDTNEHSVAKVDGTNTNETKGTNQSSTKGSNVTDTNGSGTTDTTGSSQSETKSSTRTGNTGNTQSTTESEGPYWFAYIAVRMKRRKLQSELVMKDMVEDLTKAYNEGRKVNDERYDEIVALYSIMLGRNETEGNGFIVQTADIKPLTDSVLASMKKTINDFHAVADNLADDVFKNRVKQINLKFDNELSTSRSNLITAGLYNSTTWITTSAGIERNREMALNDLIETKIDVYVKVANAGNEIGRGFMDAAAKIQAMAKERLLDPANVRNNVFKWMLDFMERRKDEFPSLDQVAGAAKQFGTGDTNVSNGVK